MYKRVLIGLDGSDCSQSGGKIAISLASKLDAELIASHVYSSELHAQRFRDMEEGLPEKYQDGHVKKELRQSHDSLISEGFDALSQGYLESLVTEARQAGINVRPVATAGRNYVKLLELAKQIDADLIVLGAQGLGDIGDGRLGSTAARVLRHATCDVLIARNELNGDAITAGIDGSEFALSAAETARWWAKTLSVPFNLAAAYDPDFHTEVFQTMARSLPEERQKQVGLDKQEGLHDELINAGLAKLYRKFLDDALEHLGANGNVESTLLTGKAYRAILDHAVQSQSGLVVVGRFGHHRQSESLIGSNAEIIAATCRQNVLVTHSPQLGTCDQSNREVHIEPSPPSVAPSDAAKIGWDTEALERLQRIPPFARPMAKRAIENTAQAQGSKIIDVQVFEQVAQKFHMGGGSDD